MIVVALAVINSAALAICSRRGLVYYDLLILECYAGLGAILGSKLLYLLTIKNQIDWKLFFSNLDYFNSCMRGGFVFWGGLITGVPFVLAGAKMHKIRIRDYLNVIAFIIPLGHGFGRIGCFLAGCCYGIESNSVIAVIYPEGSYAPVGVKILPVQLIEAVLLFSISVIIYFVFLRKNREGGIYFYFISYSIVRFILEFFRGDSYRGILWGFSTSQWISIFSLIVTLLFLSCRIFQRKQQIQRT